MEKKIIKWVLILLVFTLAIGCSRLSKEENSMQYRQLGTTGLKVSEISLGCGAFKDMSKEEAIAYMDVAIDSGINYIDLYDANPTVRDNIGYAIAGRRDKMQIQGHIGTCWVNGQYKRTRDVAETKAGFEDMLKRLGTDFIEVGMIHITDSPEQWKELENSEFLDYVYQLKKEGKIKHIGVSSHNAEVALMAAKSGIVEVIMFSLNPAFDRLNAGTIPWEEGAFDNLQKGIDPIRVELYDYCSQHNIAITVMKAFGGGGRLLNKETSQLGIEFTPIQCISYCLSKPCVASVHVGADNIEELLTDLYYFHTTDEEKEFTLSTSNTDNTKLGDCVYCHHCQPCPKQIDIVKINYLLDKYFQEGLTQELQDEYDALDKHASDCIHCGACEERCPFDVPIQERMEMAIEIFGK